jgi:acetate---CoA ligase (ADP-forming)
MSVEHLLRPRSIAVVGASARTFVGQVALQNCARRGYAGTLVPVSRRGGVIAGYPAVRSLDEMTVRADVALVQVGADHVLDVVRGALRAGVRASSLRALVTATPARPPWW